ncbi:hypothetical protein Tco_1080860 [Tanacetum coccineum]|uniref:Retrovirus-related Pol polyprotein from transposon TNT 1-94 n=1 Tax=Tanacetum coccineum TaxID=301880 RepID=A0ABQ5HWC9_9ASTR
MTPKKRTTTSSPAITTTTTTPITEDQLKALIAQGVADVVAKRDATRSINGEDSHDSGTGKVVTSNLNLLLEDRGKTSELGCMLLPIGLKSQFKNIIENVPYVPITAGQRKPEGQWTIDERKAANLDQRLKSLIMYVLPDDQMNFVINCLTTKSTWDDLILYYEGPSNVKESRDEEDVLSDDNGMTEVKVFMALADDENVDVGKETNESLVCSTPLPPLEKLAGVEPVSGPKTIKSILKSNSTFKIVTTSRYVVPTGRVKVPAGRYVVPTGKDNVIVSAGRSKVIHAAEDIKVSIPGVERPWLSKAEGFTLPNHDTGRILLAESQVKITDPLVAITDSSVTE